MYCFFKVVVTLKAMLLPPPLRGFTLLKHLPSHANNLSIEVIISVIDERKYFSVEKGRNDDID